VKLCGTCFEPFPDDAQFCPFDGKELTKTNDRFLGRTIASRYRLIKKLGSGGMSVVYLARHELISRLSAIKILRPELSRISEHRERFLREARAVNRINHENIVEISDVGESDGVAYLVMEYVEGEALLAHIQRGRLAWDRAVRIAMQVASALARAHQEGIIHRDLKPENILLVPPKSEDALEIVKLTDFGIAKVMGEPSITLNEQLFGTPGYIAPEYVGGISIDGRSGSTRWSRVSSPSRGVGSRSSSSSRSRTRRSRRASASPTSRRTSRRSSFAVSRAIRPIATTTHSRSTMRSAISFAGSRSRRSHRRTSTSRHPSTRERRSAR
jgi:serine/threonine protein kinase